MVISSSDTHLSVQVTVELKDTMMELEESIQHACNEVGSAATAHALTRFDTDGSAIRIGGMKWTSRGHEPKKYQTPYGEVEIPRHIYQTSRGGKIYCPMEAGARILRSATPRFARQIAHKYAHMNVREVQSDLDSNHGRRVARSYIQNLSDHVGAIALAKEESWDYDLPELDDVVATVALSLDGAMIPMVKEGYREAMVGAISLYNPKGERLHSIYIGEAPEYGKARFKERFRQEIERIKKRYPQALYLGVADGAKDNWRFLEPYTTKQILDFFHAAEYLPNIADAAYPGKTDKPRRKQWLREWRDKLKHQSGAVVKILEQARRYARKRKLSKAVRENLEKTIGYFDNNQGRMNYPEHTQAGLPIGSGVTEAACKTLVKQRLCGSGMRWKEQGTKIILSLRALAQTPGRWESYWQKIQQFGVPAFA